MTPSNTEKAVTAAAPLTEEQITQMREVILGDVPTDDWTEEGRAQVNAICDMALAAARAGISAPTVEAGEGENVCLSGIASEQPCQPEKDNLKRCAICGFIVDTSFKAERPSIDFGMGGRTKAKPQPTKAIAEEEDGRTQNRMGADGACIGSNGDDPAMASSSAGTGQDVPLAPQPDAIEGLVEEAEKEILWL